MVSLVCSSSSYLRTIKIWQEHVNEITILILIYTLLCYISLGLKETLCILLHIGNLHPHYYPWRRFLELNKSLLNLMKLSLNSTNLYWIWLNFETLGKIFRIFFEIKVAPVINFLHLKTNRLLNATQFFFLLRFVYEMCLGHLHVLSFGLNRFFNLFMEHTWDMIKLHTMFGPWYCEGCIYLDVYIKRWNKTRCKLRSVKMFWHIYIYIYICGGIFFA